MQTEKKLEDLKDQALALMDASGYTITQNVAVEVDPELPFMGYTTEREGHPVIIVSGFAMKGGMAINLLIHELGHVYRIQSDHPSHDFELLTAISGWVMQGKILHDYQEKILHTILNHLEDLYADDISFAIFKKNTPNTNLNEFFLSWIHERSKAKDPLQKSWENADVILSAAFAQSNLERHNVKDHDNKVAKAIEKLLKTMDPHVSDKYLFFKTFMVHMPETIGKKEFEGLLIKYLSEFLKLTKLV